MNRIDGRSKGFVAGGVSALIFRRGSHWASSADRTARGLAVLDGAADWAIGLSMETAGEVCCGLSGHIGIKFVRRGFRRCGLLVIEQSGGYILWPFDLFTGCAVFAVVILRCGMVGWYLCEALRPGKVRECLCEQQVPGHSRNPQSG